MCRQYRRTILAVMVLLAGVLANWNDTSTGIDLDKLPHFRFSKIRSGWLHDGSRATFDGITATASANPREVRLRGVTLLRFLASRGALSLQNPLQWCTSPQFLDHFSGPTAYHRKKVRL